MKNFYLLFAALVLFSPPLSIEASSTTLTRILGNEKHPILSSESIIAPCFCVTDTSSLVFTACPTNILKMPSTENSCWTINWTPPAIADNCEMPTITQIKGPTNGSCLSVGTYSVLYKATDTTNKETTCSFVITVNPYLEGKNAEKADTNKNSQTKIRTLNEVSDIGVFPNPAYDVLNLDLTKYNGLDVTISLYNLLGQQLLTQQVEKIRENVVNFDVSKNQAGNYWVRVVAKGRKDAVKQLHIAK